MNVAINAFVLSVISYLEMKRVLFQSWFRNLLKKKFLKKSSHAPVKITETIKAEMKYARRLPYFGTMAEKKDLQQI